MSLAVLRNTVHTKLLQTLSKKLTTRTHFESTLFQLMSFLSLLCGIS